MSMTEMERKAVTIVGCQPGLLLVLLLTVTSATAIQIDNRLVQPQHDCFERIALGAMLPFEKTFRNSDTNSLKICETLCLNDKECQTFAFGISGRGNGTCQLSANTIDATKSRPVGTIFDPDFDLYTRKYNCFLDGPTNPPPKPGGLGVFPGGGEFPPGGGPPGPQRPPPSSSGGSFPPPGLIDRPGPPVFEPPTTANGGFVDTSRPNGNGDYGGTAPTSGSTAPGTTYGQTNGETLPETTAPAEEYYTTKDNGHSTGGGSPYLPTSTAAATGPHYGLGGPGQTGATMPDRENPTKYPMELRPPYTGQSAPGPGGPSKPGTYPYQFPMLYETNYPLPNKQTNSGFPEIYAQNVPTLDNNYLRPEYGGTSFGRPLGPSGSTPPIENGYGGVQRPSAGGSTGYGTGGGSVVLQKPSSPGSASGGGYAGPVRPSGPSGPTGTGYGVVRPAPAPPVQPSSGGSYHEANGPDQHKPPTVHKRRK